MPTVIEPVGAGLIVALINKFIINNKDLWLFLHPRGVEKEEHEHDSTSSNTTSVNEAEIHVHHM